MLDPDKVNLDLIEIILHWIVTSDKSERKGSILVCLPGIAEITALYDLLNDHPEFSQRKGKCLLVPLHSSLTSEEQALVFKYVNPKMYCSSFGSFNFFSELFLLV